jgi:hypothetical protein
MQPELQRLELESLLAGDDNLSVEDAPLRQLCLQRIDQLREVAIEWLLVAALDEDFIPVTEEKRAEAVPLGFEDPSFARWQLAHSLCEHRKDWRIDREVHAGISVINFRDETSGSRTSVRGRCRNVQSPE